MPASAENTRSPPHVRFSWMSVTLRDSIISMPRIRGLRNSAPGAFNQWSACSSGPEQSFQSEGLLPLSHRQELKGALIALVTILGLTLLVVLLLPDPSGNYSRLGTPRSSGETEPGYPMKFSGGALDPRFGIPRAKFLKLKGEAGSGWEKPVGLELFRYDSSAPFKIEMVFDERQQRRIEERMMRGKISLTGKSFDNLRDEYRSEEQTS